MEKNLSLLLRLTAVLLFSVSLMSLLSCSKDTDSATPSRDASLLVGEWECTWSNVFYDIPENVYVGATWRFEAPTHNEYNGCDEGLFRVTVNGNVREGHYRFCADTFALPSMVVNASWDEERDYYELFFVGAIVTGSYTLDMSSEYTIELTEKAMRLYRFDPDAESFSSLEKCLTFKKIQ